MVCKESDVRPSIDDDAADHWLSSLIIHTIERASV